MHYLKDACITQGLLIASLGEGQRENSEQEGLAIEHILIGCIKAFRLLQDVTYPYMVSKKHTDN